MKGRKDKRTTVSLAHVVWVMAEEQMETKGFNDNFSAYIADLIRRDKERELPAKPPVKPAEEDRQKAEREKDIDHTVLAIVKRETGAGRARPPK